MIEVLKQALEALETTWYHVGTFAPTDDAIELYDQARTSLRQAIAELESQEPLVAGMFVVLDEPVQKLKELGWNDEAIAKANTPQLEQNFCSRCGKRTNDIHTCTPPQRTEQEPVQVSPLEFVEMVMEKEHLIGKPIFWAEWPNREKNND